MEVYNVNQVNVMTSGKLVKKKINSFNDMRGAETFKQSTLVFRPDMLIEIEKETVVISDEIHVMGHLDRMLEAENVKRELEELRFGILADEQIESRYVQLLEILNNNKILAK